MLVLTKMISIWIFVCCLLFLAVQDQVRCTRLENICYGDIFHYNGFFVNAVHRIDQVVYLPEVGHFLVPEAEEFTFLSNQSLRSQLLLVKSDYNSRLQLIYSEAYVNGPNFEREVRSESERFDQILERVQQVRDQVREQTIDSIEWFNQKTLAFRQGQKLVDYLLPFLCGQLQPLRPIGYTGLQPSKEKQFATLESYLLKRLDIATNQTFVFHDDFMTDIYEMPIVTRPKLEFNRFSRTFFDPKSHGRLRFQIVLPFYWRAYDRSAPCVATAELPKFFAKKSKNAANWQQQPF